MAEYIYQNMCFTVSAVLWIRSGFFSDPDTAFRSIRIRIQGFDHKQIVKLYIFLSKFAIFVILRPPCERRPSYRGSLQPSKTSKIKLIFSISVGHFLPLRAVSGSNGKKLMRIYASPDPQH